MRKYNYRKSPIDFGELINRFERLLVGARKVIFPREIECRKYFYGQVDFFLTRSLSDDIDFLYISSSDDNILI